MPGILPQRRRLLRIMAVLRWLSLPARTRWAMSVEGALLVVGCMIFEVFGLVGSRHG